MLQLTRRTAAILLLFAGARATVSHADSLPSAARQVTTGPDLSEHAVVLVFDDGWHSVFTNAYPLLRKHGMTAVLALISGAMTGGKLRYAGNAQGYMNRSEVQDMIDNLGVEIASHTKTHPFLKRLPDDSVRSELVESRQALEAMFHQKVVTLVYPYGEHDQRIRNLVPEAGYAMARAIRAGRVDFVNRPYDLPATEVRQSTTVEFLKTRIAAYPALILFFHRVVPAPQIYTEWSTSRLAEFLDWLDANDVQVMTAQELYEYYQGRSPEAPVIRRNWRNRVEWSLLEHVDVDVTGTAERR